MTQVSLTVGLDVEIERDLVDSVDEVVAPHIHKMRVRVSHILWRHGHHNDICQRVGKGKSYLHPVDNCTERNSSLLFYIQFCFKNISIMDKEKKTAKFFPDPAADKKAVQAEIDRLKAEHKEPTGEGVKAEYDSNGNPLNADGTLRLEKIGSIDELTDEDFTSPKRNVELPAIPKNVSEAVGAGEKPVIIKKNIFQRNKDVHRDVTPEQSRDIIKTALYSPDLYGQNLKSTRPYNWVVINTADVSGDNRIIVLEVNDNKDNVEIVHWHYVRDEALETIKRQAWREGGHILILPSKKLEEAGGLSGPTQDLSSVSKDKENKSEKQEVAFTTMKVKDSDGNEVEFGMTTPGQKEDSLFQKVDSGNTVPDDLANDTEAKRAATEAIVQTLKDSGIEVNILGEGEEIPGTLRKQAVESRMKALEKAADTIGKWIKGNERNKSFAIDLPLSTERKIRIAIGRDYYSHNITANGIAHALRNHGKKGEKINETSLPLKDEDVELIPFIMVAPDYVIKGSINNGRESVRFYKTLTNGYVVVVEKEQKNSPNDMETITMWAEKSTDVIDARTDAPPMYHVQDVIISNDIAKIRRDTKRAIENDINIRRQSVYHGSAHDFDNFDFSHILKDGEGKIYGAAVGGNLFGIHFESAEQVADRVLYDMIEGTDLSGKSESDEPERKRIIREAKANGTYMLAPNRKKSNLGERQWVDVRTKTFKDWFGDWEIEARIEKLRASKPIVITGKEVEPSDDLKQYRKNANKYGLNTLRGHYINADTGKTISVGKNSIKEVTSHGMLPLQFQSVAAVPQILERGIYIDSIANEDIEKHGDAVFYDYYLCGLRINNIDYTVKAVIANGVNGRRYYDHRLTEIEKGKLISLTAAMQNHGSESNNPLSGFKDKRLLLILQTNSSKVVDENGEPLEVYHWTDNNPFYVFDKTRLGENTDRNASDAGYAATSHLGFWFSDSS